MNLNEQIQHVELSIEEAQRIVAFGEAIQRLEANKDFQKVIFDGYFTEEAKRLVFLSADDNLCPESQNAVWAGIRSIGELRSYLKNAKALGEFARKEIEDHKETLDELRHIESTEGEL